MAANLSSPQRTLITGGSGFIGTNLIDAYLAAGVPCMSLDPMPPRNPHHGCLWVRGDTRDADALRALIDEFRPTQLFHLGARTDMEGADVAAYALNTDGVRGVIDALTSVDQPVGTVFASSRLVTPVGYQPVDEHDVCPDTPYGESKAIGERLVREATTLGRWALVRPTSIWGPWFGTPYRHFFDSVLKQRYMHPSGLRVHKTFGFVENSVAQIDAISRAPAERVDRRTFYIGDPPIEVGAFADAIAARAGLPAVRRVPLRLLRGAGKVGDLGKRLGLFGEAPLTSSRLRNICTDMVFDIDATVAVAGDAPVGVEEGIERTLSWIRSES